MSSPTDIIVEARKKIASDSPDHLVPRGTRVDNSRNRRFNEKLYRLFPGRDLRVLDIGCAGGGFVKDCIDDGYFAVGLDGSDYSRRRKRAAWGVIADSLFVCDVTGEFEVLESDESGGQRKRVMFDVVTSWELMEHIPERDIQAVAGNVNAHLRRDGLWITSIANKSDCAGGVEYHVTLRPKTWWIEKMRECGFVHNEEYVEYFNTQFVRGQRHENPENFHLVLSPDPAKAPPIPAEGLLCRIMDRWVGSGPQEILRKIVTGY